MVSLLIVLRIIHIVTGTFWAGGSFVMTGYVEPTVRAAGDDGRRFMQRLGATSGFSRAMAVAAGSNVLAGLWLLWIVSDGYRPAFFEAGRGLALGLGMLTGIAAFVVGFALQNRSIRRMTALGQAIAASGKPPSPEQTAEMAQHNERVRLGGRIVSALLLVTVGLMAAARYLPS